MSFKSLSYCAPSPTHPVKLFNSGTILRAYTLVEAQSMLEKLKQDLLIHFHSSLNLFKKSGGRDSDICCSCVVDEVCAVDRF